jgi:pyruvate/2-oxoglutarate/acetoin dehydrogenase E1 component/TPP-dependent pyruvate/acetoin dehydrogenase alpha subunit
MTIFDSETAARTSTESGTSAGPSLEELGVSRDDVLRDYRVSYESRQTSLVGRREVLTGKAKFGIFGDGKEVPQVAMARVFEPGDFRAGYYRDQTFMMALGELTVQQFFAQLYAHADGDAEPMSSGRQMTAHFATRMVDGSGRFLPQTDRHNVPADLSPTASQMPKLVGLAHASRLYREVPSLSQGFEGFSDGGREVAFGTIGNASCAEGLFWETVNAVGVLRAPMVLSIWDDGYGISVANDLQVCKGDVGELLEGFQRSAEGSGYRLYKVRGWHYPELLAAYRDAVEHAREGHVPAILHVREVTQPQGHSTSGSHERYKSAERLQWEKDNCCIRRMREWILSEELASEEELDRMEKQARERVLDQKLAAWKAYRSPIESELETVVQRIQALAGQASGAKESVEGVAAGLLKKQTPIRRDLLAAVQDALVAAAHDDALGGEAARDLLAWKREQLLLNRERYGSELYSESAYSALEVPVVAPIYREGAEEGEGGATVNGFEVLNACFDAALARHPNLVAFGEDVGKLGDVNQGFAGLQEKYGELRVSDTGIREATIMGQAIGLALRGIRPIAEVQYLDYILYCLQILSDDLATLRYRTKGRQKAPVIIRTRGHRLEGIWHSGSPMAGVINLVRGIYVCVPRDMTQAAGMYNTLLQADDPAIVVEVLNGYRSKERLPANVGEMTVPLGVPEVLREGSDVTVVSYGAALKVVMEAAELLEQVDVDIEVIDVQTLLPFDLGHRIVESLKKTGRVVFVDEDVPGGGTAYMMQQVLEVQRGYLWLDSEPRTVPAAAHRPPYGSDGDYFSKPNRETVFEAVYELMKESDPASYPSDWS